MDTDFLYASEKLICNNNDLIYLPEILVQIKEIHCYSNLITSLPPLNDGLRSLYCDNNVLVRLPALPSTLQELHCYNNHITHLPPLPEGLKDLYCSNNILTQLPKLPDSLIHLECKNNPFVSPFKEFVKDFQLTYDLVQLKHNVNTYWRQHFG